VQHFFEAPLRDNIVSQENVAMLRVFLCDGCHQLWWMCGLYCSCKSPQLVAEIIFINVLQLVVKVTSLLDRDSHGLLFRFCVR